MAATDDGSPVDFDGHTAMQAARDAAGPGLLICVAFDADDVETLYVDDRVREMYPDEEAMHDHFAEVHSYVHLDFTEREMFEDLFLDSGGVRAFATYLDNMTAIRVLGDGEGLFVALAPDAPVTETVEAVERALD